MNMKQGVAALAIFLAASSPGSGADGDPDPGFGTDGRVVLAFDQDPLDRRDFALRVVAEGDHAYVLGAIRRPENFVSSITRLLNDGSPDDGFGDEGTLFLDTLDGFYDDYRLADLALDGQGRLVGAGFATLGANTDMLLCRILPEGDLDVSFGGNGSGCNTVAIDAIPNGYDSAASIALQPNGRILIGGTARLGTDVSQMAVARFNAGGILDDSFGTVDGSGYSTVAFPPWQSASVASIAVDPQGRVVLGGTVGNDPAIFCDADFAFARLLPTGKTDNEFSGDGRVTIGFDAGPVIDGCYYWKDTLKRIVVLPDSSIVAAGSALFSSGGFDHKLAMVKLHEQGTTDGTFGVDGLLDEHVCDVCVASDIADMTMQPDGGLLVAGQTQTSTTTDFVIMRRLSDGTPDHESGISISHVPFVLADGDGHDVASAITLQNGKPLVAGYRESPLDPWNYDMAIVRLQVDLIFENDFELQD